MRVVFNAISYVVPPSAIALTLWATWQWDLPVPIALAFVSLAWAYCLGLVVAAWNASREDESTKDVQLERGVVQSMTHRSQDLAEIQILVGDVTQVFTAAEGALAYLAPRDSVMFAYMHQPREIINIATIDVSTPGRVARVGGWKRSGNAELLGRFWPRLLTRKDLYNQAFVATILPGGCGAAATGGLALGVWGWGWPGAAFLALVGIWLILNMVVYSVSNNWERMAAMELDVGHVQEVEEWESYFSDSGKIPNQSIVIAETAARDSVNQRTYQYEGEELFAVRVGDLVMLSTSAWGQILDLRNESRPTLQQPGASSRIRLQEELEDRRRQWAEELPDRLQQWAEEVVQSFPDSLGIDARILRQDPLRSEATLTEDQRYDEDLAEAETWFEIAEGPIRWMHCSDDFSGIFGSFASLFVPDSRIHADFPRISIRLVTEKGIR